MLKEKIKMLKKILACLNEIFQETTIQKEAMIYTNDPQSEFKNKYMIKSSTLFK